MTKTLLKNTWFISSILVLGLLLLGVPIVGEVLNPKPATKPALDQLDTRWYRGGKVTLGVNESAETPFLEYRTYAGGLATQQPYLTVKIFPSGKIEAVYGSFTTRRGRYETTLSQDRVSEIVKSVLDSDLLLRGDVSIGNRDTFKSSGTLIAAPDPAASYFYFNNVTVVQGDKFSAGETHSSPKNIILRASGLQDLSAHSQGQYGVAELSALAVSLKSIARELAAH